MKRFLYLIAFCALIMPFSFADLTGGEWENEIRVTADPTDQTDAEFTTAPDDTMFLAWPEDNLKKVSIHLIKSTDFGKTWTAPSVIMGPDDIYDFSMKADAAGLHLAVIRYDSSSDSRLYYTKSTDGGTTFAPLVQLGSWKDVFRTEIFCGDGWLLIYARDVIGGNLVYLSADEGATWKEESLLSGQSVENPVFVIDDAVIHTAFGGFINQGISYSRSKDFGSSWLNPIPVSSGAGAHSQCPTLAVEGNIIHVAWEDDREGYFNVMYSRSIDNGFDWSPDARINDTFYGARVKLLDDPAGLHIAWCQYHGPGWPGNWGSGDYGIIRYKYSVDSGAGWSGEFRVSQNDFIPPLEYPDKGANYVDLDEHSLGICAYWRDKRDGNVEIYMRNKFSHLVSDIHEIPIIPGDTIHFSLAAGMNQAQRSYLLLGGVSGTVPGTPLPKGATVLPLNWDLFTSLTVLYANTPVFEDFLGTLDGVGSGSAAFHMGPLHPSFAGIRMSFAYALNHPWNFASNPVSIRIVM